MARDSGPEGSGNLIKKQIKQIHHIFTIKKNNQKKHDFPSHPDPKTEPRIGQTPAMFTAACKAATRWSLWCALVDTYIYIYTYIAKLCVYIYIYTIYVCKSIYILCI